ncbi:MAG: response regulator, partial [Actinomycetaceae bacterium]
MTDALPDQPARIRVALVDDQQLVRAGFALVIGTQPDMEVVGEAGDGAQALRMLGTVVVDVVLMDVRMPNLDGLAATKQLTEDAPASGRAARVVML